MGIDGTKIRQDLHRMLTQAAIDLEMWQAMNTARCQDDVVLMLNRRYGRFYMAAENALLNSMITILYAVFEKRADTVNFWQLKASLGDIADPSRLRELEGKYASVKQTWKKICVIRNEVVGHQSLERSASQSHEIAGLTVDHVKRMITSCKDLLFEVARDFHDTHVIFSIQGTDSFDRLISDLRAFNDSKAAHGAPNEFGNLN